MGCGAGARLPWVGERSAWEKRGRGSLGKDLKGARAQDLPDRLGQPHSPDSAEAPRVAAAMGGGCPDKLYLSLKLGRASWGPKMSQGAGLWFSHQQTRTLMGILDHCLAGPFPVVTLSPKALAGRDTPGTQCLTPGSTCFHLLVKVLGLSPVHFLWQA